MHCDRLQHTATPKTSTWIAIQRGCWCTWLLWRDSMTYRYSFICHINESLSHVTRVILSATHCRTLQYTATHCNTLQHTATHCRFNDSSLLMHMSHQWVIESRHTSETLCNSLPHTAAHCNTLQHIAAHCNTLQHTVTYQEMCYRDKSINLSIWELEIHCSILQYAATPRNTFKSHVMGTTW